MNQRPTLGFIGLGAMGEPMVRNLLAAGYTVCGFDLDVDRLAACVEAGMRP
ncbi:MAG: 3-hydroxyisobutyrate dehydrogenase, partial [Chloroflexi bacterium]